VALGMDKIMGLAQLFSGEAIGAIEPTEFREEGESTWVTFKLPSQLARRLLDLLGLELAKGEGENPSSSPATPADAPQG